MTDKQELLRLAASVGAIVDRGFFGGIKAIHWHGNTYWPRMYPDFGEFARYAIGWKNLPTGDLPVIAYSRWSIVQVEDDPYYNHTFSIWLDHRYIGRAMEVRNWDGVTIDRVIFHCAFKDLTIYALGLDAATRLINARNDKFQAERKAFADAAAADVAALHADTMRSIYGLEATRDNQHKGVRQ